jgi:hypothetical protein
MEQKNHFLYYLKIKSNLNWKLIKRKNKRLLNILLLYIQFFYYYQILNYLVNEGVIKLVSQ